MGSSGLLYHKFNYIYPHINNVEKDSDEDKIIKQITNDDVVSILTNQNENNINDRSDPVEEEPEPIDT